MLGRTALGEASALIFLLTPEFGLVRARVQGVRKPGAKLAAALQTFSECDVTLVHGREGWRLAGALLSENRFIALSPSARERAGRVASLLLRLVRGEGEGPTLYEAFAGLLVALSTVSEEEADAAECLAALRIVHALGFDDGTVPGTDAGSYATQVLAETLQSRKGIVGRINRGLTASGL